MLRSVFRRNGDASNMSPTDIRIGIPESAGRRPEAHVFPFPCRARQIGIFLFFPRSELNFFDSPVPLEIYTYGVCARQRVRDLITVKEEIARESSIVVKSQGGNSCENIEGNMFTCIGDTRFLFADQARSRDARYF